MDPPEGAVVEVAAALIQDEAGRYLVSRRPPASHLAGLWEFPGGKCEPGESLEDCLRRELREELAIEVVVGQKLETIRWRYPEKTVVLHFFRCRLESGQPQPRERQVLAWVEPERLADYDFPPADRALLARLRA